MKEFYILFDNTIRRIDWIQFTTMLHLSAYYI